MCFFGFMEGVQHLKSAYNLDKVLIDDNKLNIMKSFYKFDDSKFK